MPGPWEKYQSSGPWEKYKDTSGPWDKYAQAMSAESELAVAGAGSAAALAAGAVAFPATGIAGLGALKAGGGPKEVYEAMEATNKAISPTLTPTDEAAVGKLMYPFELLNKGATEAQEYVTEKTGSKIAGATVGTGIEAGALLLGPKVAGKVKEGIRSVREMKGLEGPWAKYETIETARTAEMKPWEKYTDEVKAPIEEVKPEIKADEVKVTEPSIVEPTEGEPTSMKNAVTTAERESRGLDPLETEARKSIPLFDEAKKSVESTPEAPRLLAEELVNKFRETSLEEQASLGVDRMRIINERDAVQEAQLKAIENGDTSAVEQLKIKADVLDKAYENNDIALKKIGSSWHTSGMLRQQMIARDYSLSAMIRKAKIQSEGKPIPTKHMAELENFAKQIKYWTEKAKASEEKVAFLEAEKATKRIKLDVDKEVRQAKRVRAKQELSVEFDDLVKELNKTLGGQLNVGLDPTAIVIIGKMAKNRVQAGYLTAEALVDHIYTATKKIGLDISKRDIRDAISGYGAVPKKATKSELTAQLNTLKKEMRQMSKAEDVQSGKIAPDATAQKSAKTRMENKIKDLERRLEEGDYSKPERKKLELNPENLHIKYQLDKLIKQYHQASFKNELANRTKLERVASGSVEALNLSRALKTSFDLSAVFRQGGLLHLGSPRLLKESNRAMFKALKSEKGEFAVNEEIRQRPNYKYYEQAGLYLAEHGTELSKAKMEEAYMSRHADIPINIGGKNVNPISASQRAYSANLNQLRADKFDYMLDKLVGKGKKPTTDQLKAIGTFINEFTGRGSIHHKLASAFVGLNSAFFAPRYVASRFQVLLGHPLWNKAARNSPIVQRMIAMEYAKTLTGIATVIGIGLALGGKLEVDPRSSDLGKLKFGNTRIDPLAGLSQTTVLLGRMILGASKGSTGKIMPLREDWVYGVNNPKVEYGKSDAASVLGRFLRSKLSPVVGTTVDLLSSKNVVGGKVTLKDVPEALLMPLSFNDIYDIMKEEGVAAGTAMAVLGLFGMGLQNYKPGSKDSQFYTSRTSW